MKKTMLVAGFITLMHAFGAVAQTASSDWYACNFNDGKTVEDLLKVSNEWNDWFDNNATSRYTAYVMTPVLGNFADHPEVIWMGFSPTPSELGRTMDEWMTKGGKLQKKFNAVVNCSAHALQGVRAIRSYEKLGEAGFVQVQSCERRPGVSWGQVAHADERWGTWMEENNIPGGYYRWWSGTGSPRGAAADPDLGESEFQQVWITESMEQRGQGIEAYRATGTGVADSYGIYGDDSLYVCDTARVWYAQPVGGTDPD